jgi:hypothetical protein
MGASQRTPPDKPYFGEIDFQLYWFGALRLGSLAGYTGLSDERYAKKICDDYGKDVANAHGLGVAEFWRSGGSDGGWRWPAVPDRFWFNAWKGAQPPDVSLLLQRIALRNGLLVPVGPPPRKLERRGRGRKPVADRLGQVPVDAPHELDREPISGEAVRTLLRAILPPPDEPEEAAPPREVHIRYASPGRPDSTVTIVPHALTHDTFRWAVRAVDSRGEARDYVLHRIASATLGAVVAPARAHDPAWHERPVTVRLRPRLGPGADPARIERQYCMEDGELAVEMRRCMVVYFLKRLQLETDLVDIPSRMEIAPTGPDDVFEIPGRKAHQQPLTVANPAEVRSWIPRQMRIPSD